MEKLMMMTLKHFQFKKNEMMTRTIKQTNEQINNMQTNKFK